MLHYAYTLRYGKRGVTVGWSHKSVIVLDTEVSDRIEPAEPERNLASGLRDARFIPLYEG